MGAGPSSQGDIISPSSPFQNSPLPAPTPPPSLAPSANHRGPVLTVQDAKENRKTTEEQNKGQIRKKMPHNFNSIIKEADTYLYSGANLEDYMYSGIFLNNKTKKFWVDSETGHNCFTLFPRALSITWSEEPKYWQWLCLKETSEVEIEVASLVSVCWLEIHGKIDSSYLSPGVAYEVVFTVMMSEQAFGWQTPVNLIIKLQDGRVQERKECLHHKPKGKWTEIKVGEVMTRQSQAGEMEVSMLEYEGGHWKGGIVIKNVTMRPKKYM